MKQILFFALALLQVCSFAATPIHTYTFTTGLDDSSGNLPIEALGGVVMSGRYEFGANEGLVLNPDLTDVSTFSLEMVFRLNELRDFYNKLIDFSNLQTDNGLYAGGSLIDNSLVFYFDQGAGTDSFVEQTDYAVVLTREADGTTSVYLDGVLQFAQVNEFSLPEENVISFFVDDLLTSQIEAVSGSVDYLKVYDVALSQGEVEALVYSDADVTSRDLFEMGDGLITYDPATNLEWLDITETIGNSVNDVLSGVGGWAELGFTVATENQVEFFWNSLGVTDIGQDTIANATGVQTSFDFNGCTFLCSGSGFRRTNGLSISTAGTATRLSTVDLLLNNEPDTGNVRFTGFAGGFDYSVFSGGVYVIRQAEELDSDLDGVADFEDNCTLVDNADQRDTDIDGYGNACDPDLNNDGVVNFADISLWAPFFNTVNDGNQDFNGDGVANFADYALFATYFLQPPGPGNVLP